MHPSAPDNPTTHDPTQSSIPSSGGASNGVGPSRGRSNASSSAPAVAEEELRREGAPERELGVGEEAAAEQPAVVRAADEAALYRVARRRERDDVRREERVDVRYSVDEKARILAKAKALGIAGAHLVGALVMAFLNGDQRLSDQRTPYDDVIDEFAALRAQVARIGGNVNQIARRLNSDGYPHPVDVAVLERAERLLVTARETVQAVDEAAFRAAEQKAGRA